MPSRRSASEYDRDAAIAARASASVYRGPAVPTMRTLVRSPDGTPDWGARIRTPASRTKTWRATPATPLPSARRKRIPRAPRYTSSSGKSGSSSEVRTESLSPYSFSARSSSEMRSRSAYGDGPRGFSARSISSASASSKPSASPPPASSTTRRAGSELSPGGSSSSSRPGSAPMRRASAAASSSCRRSNSLSLSMRGSYRTARGGQTGARLAPRMARGLIPLPTPAERDAIVRAKARLDRLWLYPRPVAIGRVRIFHTPWLFALPWFRRFDGYEAGPLIFLRRPLAETPDDLIVHELCHVWQSQHPMIPRPLSSLGPGSAQNRHEVEARYAAATTRDPG